MESTVRRGYATWASSATPDMRRGNTNLLQIKDTTQFGYVFFALPSIVGRTVLSATLTMHVEGAAAAQTWTAQRVTEGWTAGTLTWTNRPAAAGTACTVITGALVDGDEVAINVQPILAQVAAGTNKWYGLRISTNAVTNQKLTSFPSGQDSFTLTYELSDQPEKPTRLAPDGGIVSTLRPVLGWDFTDFGGSTEQTSFQVQIDPLGAGGGTADFDTGTVFGVDPQLDLNAFTTSSLLNPGFDTNATNWAAVTNCAVARSTAQFHTTPASLSMTSSAAGLMRANNTDSQPCIPGQTYYAEAFSRAATAARSVSLELAWLDAGGATLSTTAGSTVTNSTANFNTKAVVTGVAPANAVTYRVRPVVAGTAAASEVHYWDDFYTAGGGTRIVDLTTGQSTQWRVRVTDGAGLTSDWSDWAPWTYRPDVALVMDSPSGTELSDPSPTILAHITGGTLTAYRIRIAAGNDRTDIRYDSKKTAADDDTNIAHTIPFKDEDRRRIFADDTSYWLNVRVWDSYASDREALPGDPPYVETWVLVTFDDDAAVTAPVLSSVTQPGSLPKLRLVWTRGSAPDNWVVTRDGTFYARLDPAAVSSGGGTYTWDDPDFTAAFELHTWRVKAVVGNVQGPPSNGVNFTPTLSGVWLVDEDTGNGVKFRGTGIDDWKQQDRYVVYKPIRRAVSVVIFDAQEGFTGSFTGVLRDETGTARATALARLQTIKNNPTKPVWLLAADLAIRVRVFDLSYPPHGDTMPGGLKNNVSFRFEQASGIPYGVGI